MGTYYTHIKSPIGRLMLTANERALTGLYFSTGDKARKEPDPVWQACEGDCLHHQELTIAMQGGYW